MSMPRVPHAPRGSGPDPAESGEALRQLQNLSRLRQAAAHRPLTDEEQAELSEEPACIHCGGFHARSCPRVKRIAFHQNGKISEVEYWPDAEVNWNGVVFEDVGGEDDEIPVEDLQTLLMLADGSLAYDDSAAALARRVAAWLEHR